ncbi:MAG: ribosome silencing factor [Bacteroidales bacterium]|nr:ribosome silencing factor [Bacteroidales bacterium]
MVYNGDDALPLVKGVIEGLLDKQGEQILKLDMRRLENAVCSYFIICHARSTTQVDALAESVELLVKRETGERPLHKEGLENCLWVLLDYGNVVVHIFQEEQREFYRLEELWADADTELVEENNRN